MRPERSIRRRLLAGMIVGVGALLVVAGLVADAALERHEREVFDRALLTTARALATLTKARPGGPELDFADELMPRFSAPREPDYFELRDAHDRRIERSRSLRDATLPFLAPLPDGYRFSELSLPDGRRGRLVQLDFEVHADDHAGDANSDTGVRARIVVAQSREELDRLLSLLRGTLAAATAVVLALAAFLAHSVVRRGLQPLAALNAQIAGIDATDLSARLHSTHRYVETEAIIDQFNALLGRLQSAFERERRFSANAAHELRTPIAEIRNLADVGAQWSDDASLARRSLREISDASRQMERLVATLLAIARNEHGIDAWPAEDVELGACVEAAVARHAAAAAARRIGLAFEGSGPVRVRAARELIERMLDNLLANAIEYSPEGSAVACTLTLDGMIPVLTVANPTQGLGPEDAERALEPMWRKDPARAGREHLGLGLNLVQCYAQQFGMALELSLDKAGTFRATLRGGHAGADAPHSAQRPMS